jgi:hypothetical protein
MGHGPVYAARVGLHYRALAIRKPDYWLWFWIGTHADYDKLLAQLKRGSYGFASHEQGRPLFCRPRARPLASMCGA